jgi:hypothetical protein
MLCAGVIAIIAVLLGPQGICLHALPLIAAAPQEPAPQQEAPKLPNDQLDSLVAPIALYPDPLLTQTLVASTYPLEVIQLQQWLEKHKDLKDKALADAVQNQNWDPSIQAMASFPDVVKQLAGNIKWTTDLGNAFLAQQGDVMDAVQRMRKKAKDAGQLKSSEQQKVETKVVENKSVVVIEPASPQVVYVPSYNPTVVYGAPVYPYPPIAYPPPGYYAAGMALSFGVGVAMGAAWGGGWGWNAGWGHNDVDINVNNRYNKANVNNARSLNRTGNRNTWQHNPQHRGGAPYSNGATAARYGGMTRGASQSARQASARQYQAGQAGTRSTTGSAGNLGARTGGASAPRGDFSRSASAGSRDMSAFGGSGSSGAAARASSQRGASSFGGGGGFRGGGGRGGGRRR